MAYDGYNLPAYHFFATFDDEGMPEYQTCPMCKMYFTQMSLQPDIEAHIARCTEQAAEEAKQRVALGYKETSKGWFKGDAQGGVILP